MSLEGCWKGTRAFPETRGLVGSALDIGSAFDTRIPFRKGLDVNCFTHFFNIRHF